MDEYNSDKFAHGLTEIENIIEYEIRKIEKAIVNIKKNPKPDLEYMIMPEKMKCYREGLKYTHKIIGKYKQLEVVMYDEENGKL